MRNECNEVIKDPDGGRLGRGRHLKDFVFETSKTIFKVVNVNGDNISIDRKLRRTPWSPYSHWTDSRSKEAGAEPLQLRELNVAQDKI